MEGDTAPIRTCYEKKYDRLTSNIRRIELPQEHALRCSHINPETLQESSPHRGTFAYHACQRTGLTGCLGARIQFRDLVWGRATRHADATRKLSRKACFANVQPMGPRHLKLI